MQFQSVRTNHDLPRHLAGFVIYRRGSDFAASVRFGDRGERILIRGRPILIIHEEAVPVAVLFGRIDLTCGAVLDQHLVCVTRCSDVLQQRDFVAIDFIGILQIAQRLCLIIGIVRVKAQFIILAIGETAIFCSYRLLARISPCKGTAPIFCLFASHHVTAIQNRILKNGAFADRLHLGDVHPHLPRNRNGAVRIFRDTRCCVVLFVIIASCIESCNICLDSTCIRAIDSIRLHELCLIGDRIFSIFKVMLRRVLDRVLIGIDLVRLVVRIIKLDARILGGVFCLISIFVNKVVSIVRRNLD